MTLFFRIIPFPSIGAPTGLMALQGLDTNGETIRSKMNELGVSTEFVRASNEYSTSVSHILLEPSGERTILMAPASTSRLTGEKMKKEFGNAVATRASMITTEISQVPLSGVEFLLNAAHQARIPALLDVDVTPTVATGPAQLGTIEELRRCVTKATVLKLTASAAGELLALVSNNKLESSLELVAQQLADSFGVKMCVVTDGSRGSALAMGKSSGVKTDAVRVPIYSGVIQKDATGAGDAFFGGIIATLHTYGLPTNADTLARVGRIAAASGAACVEVLGALPLPQISPARMVALCEDAKPLVAAGTALTNAAKHPSSTTTRGAEAPKAADNTDVYEAWLASLLRDGDALSEVASHYTLQIATATDAVASLVKSLGSCSSATSKSSIVYCTGLGKSGAVASRLALSLRSIGLRAAFVHGSEWTHGDLGTTGADDVIIAFSHSGKTAELVDAMNKVKTNRGSKIFSITSDSNSPLAKLSSAHFRAPAPGELLDTIPTRSIINQEAVSNAIISAVVTSLGVTKEKFQAFHPGGSIGSNATAGTKSTAGSTTPLKK